MVDFEGSLCVTWLRCQEPVVCSFMSERVEKSHERVDPPAAAESSSSWDPTAPGSDHFHSSSPSQEEEGEEGEELQLFFFSLYLAAQSGGCCSESISGPVQQRLGRIKPGSVHTLHFNLLQTIISLVGVGLLTKAEGCGPPPPPLPLLL